VFTKEEPMVRKSLCLAVALLLVASAGHAADPAQKPFIFGLLLVGPYNDRGWSQAHYDAGLYVERKLPGTKMIYLDKVNPTDRPGLTLPQLVDDLIAKGARLIIANSDDMKDGAREAARRHPGVTVIHVSGDDVLTRKAPPNLGNIMGRMEYGKMMAGFVAALTTQTGKIGYLGPLINEETRRLAVSSYLGAAYGWEKVGKRLLADLKFKVSWIGFWFNIPGVTSDPTQVADNFFQQGYDVVVSGIDTTEAEVEAGKLAASGKQVWAIPYDFPGSLDEAPTVALGVPYFNWGPAYLKAVTMARDGQWTSYWEWNPPDWSDINNPDTSAVGFKKGEGLSGDASATLDEFIAALAGGLNLWTGPLNLQDGTEYLPDGQVATPQQIWYLPQLLQGMEGQSVSE
jgi:simple sugar transport system substrate-binding protein